MKESKNEIVRQILTNYLESNNHRKTPERYTILDAVYGIDGHFSLQELGEKLAEEHHFIVSRATLYNTIKLFLDLRLVIRHRFIGETRYEACYNTSSHCHQICTICGKVIEIHSPEIDNAMDNLHLKRFRKDGCTIYIYGICSSCQAKMTRQNSMNDNKKQQNHI